ncbi:hypothetical protein NM688_g3324 [Phlebia brevispora]|uniref:Uncharacterized protein n=1 Tax=Phlebia brevispora TaxID=194682 RepID=A0ACC1T696_9APHY|nr:hypothetical protein NM688_g3324 [Phlebia brevispora]
MAQFPPVPDTLNYIFCNTPADFHNAVWVLRHHPYLILDCEGHDLGRAGGCVTLVCVGTPLAEHIFLFDVISPHLSRYDIDALLNLFNDRNILKVVWDGRMDYLELWSTYGVSLENVLDLQVAEVVSRGVVRGEGEIQRMKRLQQSYISTQVSDRLGARLDGLHAVIGLQRCWKECGFPAGNGKDPAVVKMHKSIGSRMWVERPLTEQLLQYAAKDILLIGILYAQFSKQGWIPRLPSDYYYLLGQCQRYVSAHREQGKSAAVDAFKPCQIMPLDVLDHPVGPKYRCNACHRYLSLATYETVQGVAPRQASTSEVPRITTLRRPRCRLCQILALRAGFRMDQTYLVT